MAPKEVKKREVPTALRRLMDLDVSLTKRVFEHADRTYGLANYRKYLKYLEVSCHGLTWLGGTFAMVYLFPEKIHLWMNVLWLLLLDIVVVAITKAFTRRRRPSYNQHDMFVTVSVDKFSFPSGHATRAIAVFFFFAFLYPLPALVVLPIGAWSLAVCASRVLLGRHHVLDVAGGIAIGFGEYLLLSATWLSEERAKYLSGFFLQEDPWSNA